MREELYKDLKRVLCDIEGVKHVDLWNHNVDFIEQEAAWERPAVFIEFQPIRWDSIVTGCEYRAKATINLHVVTDWTEESNIEQFRLLNDIQLRVAGMSGESYADFDLVSSITNHNHEDIVENIETYSCVGFRSIY